MNKPVVMIKDLNKSCGTCTACCSGALAGEAHGHHFYRGRPCFFLTTTGCGIYESRPDTPCKSYKCGYLSEAFFPEWMRPDLSGALATGRVHSYKEKVQAEDGTESEVDRYIPYMHVMGYQQPLSGKALMWFIEQHLAGGIPNLLIDIEGGLHRVGRPDFLAARL